MIDVPSLVRQDPSRIEEDVMGAVTGGCLCGAIRYEALVTPVDTGYCHCRMCQRVSGAPVQAWASFPLAQFSYVKGEPQTYQSSSHGERRFCGRCGSSLEYRERKEPTAVSVNAGTLDDPSLAPPTKHIWTMSQITWFATADELPDYSGNGKDP
jgi:hypothetical protein